MRLILLPFVEKGLQFGTVSGNHFFLYFGCLDHHRDLIIVGADQSLTPFKLGNGAHFCAGKLERFPDMLSLIGFEVQDNLVFRVVDNGSAIPSVIETKEVR